MSVANLALGPFMPVTDVAGRATTSANSSVASATGSSANGQDAAQQISDRFLKLLVAQMKNQDPLNPLENAEVTSQMAQINTVNGITQLNGTMQSMADQFSGLQSMQAAGLVGRQMMVPSETLTIDDDGGIGGFVLEQEAADVAVRFIGSAGEAVHQESLGAHGPGTHEFLWSGTLADGSKLANGSYRMQIVARDAEGRVMELPSFTRSTIAAVRPDVGGTRVVDAAGREFELSAVRQIS